MGVIVPTIVVLTAFWRGGQMFFVALMESGVGWERFVLAAVIAGCGLSVESSLMEGAEGYNVDKC